MASLRKLTELSPLFLCTGGGSVTVGEGWRNGLGDVSSTVVAFWSIGNKYILLCTQGFPLTSIQF